MSRVLSCHPSDLQPVRPLYNRPVSQSSLRRERTGPVLEAHPSLCSLPVRVKHKVLYVLSSLGCKTITSVP